MISRLQRRLEELGNSSSPGNSLAFLIKRPRHSWLAAWLWLWLSVGWAMGQWAMVVHPVAHPGPLSSWADQTASTDFGLTQSTLFSSAKSHWWDVLLGHHASNMAACQNLDGLCVGSAVSPNLATPFIEWPAKPFYFFTHQEASIGSFTASYWATGPPLSHL
jgi:hypothetical protein